MSLWSSECKPAWIVPIVPSGRELQASAWLARNGINAWYPTDTIYVRDPRRPDKRIPKIKAAVGGYLFVHTNRIPVRDFWVRRSLGKITDIFHWGDKLVMMGDGAFGEMRQMPDRLEAMRQAAIEAATIRVGDTATITGGNMNGWTITVDSISGGVAFFDAPIGKGKVELERLVK